jgi:hypothetical protein
MAPSVPETSLSLNVCNISMHWEVTPTFRSLRLLLLLMHILNRAMDYLFICRTSRYWSRHADMFSKKHTYYSGINIFSNLPSSLKSLVIEKAKFKVVLKRYLNTHSFYSVDEFLVSKTVSSSYSLCNSVSWEYFIYIYMYMHVVWNASVVLYMCSVFVWLIPHPTVILTNFGSM